MRGPALTTLLLLAAAAPPGAMAGGGDPVIPPILGPEGPMWLGAVTPDDPAPKQRGREWILVDPGHRGLDRRGPRRERRRPRRSAALGRGRAALGDEL
ncbi:MAG: hypothetical protein IPN01_28145 [Deltaproteobacteria bacterium]|nr:hypothetical protein [Deltaproteobacteria bacterium]